MLKKLFGITIALIIVAIIILAIWFFFFREDAEVANNIEGEPRQFFPTQNNSDIDDGRPDPEPIDPDTIVEDPGRESVPSFRQISSEPVAGMMTFKRLSSSTEIVFNEFDEEEVATSTEVVYRYLERGTGHLYETTDISLTKKRISNFTIPRIHEAHFASKDDVIFQYLDNSLSTMETFKATVVERDPEEIDLDVEELTILEGEFLTRNIRDLTLSPQGDIAYLLNEATSSSPNSGIFTTGFNTSLASLLYQSPLKEWIITWPSQNTITLTTKPHSDVLGYMYTLNTTTGEAEKVIDGVNGLTTNTSPDGAWILASASRGNDISLVAGNLVNDEGITLDIVTLPEKCAWSKVDNSVVYCAEPIALPRSPYPESWYKGEVSFRDNIWKVNLETNEYELILDGETFSEENDDTGTATLSGDFSFDIIRPQISEDDEYIVFINKNDLTLWSLDLQI